MMDSSGLPEWKFLNVFLSVIHRPKHYYFPENNHTTNNTFRKNWEANQRNSESNISHREVFTWDLYIFKHRLGGNKHP